MAETNYLSKCENFPYQVRLPTPILVLANVSADPHALCQYVLSQCVIKRGLTLLLHGKPFAGTKGSGKTSAEQHIFVAFVAVIAYAIKVHGDALLASVGLAGNDHRLGAQDAFLAVIFIGTGLSLEEHVKDIVAGRLLAVE